MDILEKICDENLAVYRASPGRLQEDVSQESQVAHDYRGRLVYELLQNADDSLAGTRAADDRVLFRLTDRELWVANTGRPFTEADIRGLSGLGASSKTAPVGHKRASIGHKGLGFKSVLEITDAPEAYSEAVAFRLGKAAAYDRVTRLWTDFDRGRVLDVPAMRFPSPLEPDNPAWRALRSDGFHTAFRFPFHDRISLDQVATLRQQLLTLPMTSVLFLKHLEEVVIEVETSNGSAQRQWLLERHRVADGQIVQCTDLDQTGIYRVDLNNQDGEGDRYWVAHNGEVPIGRHRVGLSGPAWDGVDVTEVSVAVRDASDPRVEPPSRRFHVFLPTQEHSGCSMLVNGAFATDLSRQHIPVDESPFDYNGYLIDRAAETFVQLLLPHLLNEQGPRYVLQVLDRTGGEAGPAAALLGDALTTRLAATPLIPANGGTVNLAQIVLPTPLLREQGPDFAALLSTGTQLDGRRFPIPEFCDSEMTTACAAYGAQSLTATQTLHVLANHCDPSKSMLGTGPDPRYRIDPVLSLCELMWDRADSDERQQLEEAAPNEPVFPVGEDEAGTVHRIRLGNESAFYPPASSAGGLHLQRIHFLAHAVCWGQLAPHEQASVLKDRMKSWDALFGIKEFRFEEVMRAAVLPGLARGPSDSKIREANRSIDALATICRLAGKTTKPEQPLPMSRLGSDRALFNLSRLEVPCRTGNGEDLAWAPAYQVYFGRDWVGEDSVEGICDAMAEVGAQLEVKFLAAPEKFAAYSDALGVPPQERDGAQHTDFSDQDEDDIEDETDEALETTVDERWRNFFSWLGVSRGLRLVPFHDVDDRGTGWTSTKDLGLPGGWAFRGLEDAWSAYRKALIDPLKADPRWGITDHYLYQAHNLDHLDQIASQAQKAHNDVAGQLIGHLVRNWSSYSRHTQAELALVGSGKVPNMRNKPARAMPEELATAGPDFWLHRLRDHAICPTSHGPRRPGQTWRRTDELKRRFGRSGRNEDTYLPVLAPPPEGVARASLQACLDELEVRGELTPAEFTIDDARALCQRLADVHGGGVTEQIARKTLRPIYRELFELLVGTRTQEKNPLAGAPLAANTPTGIKFLPARDTIYASVPGSRERSGVQGSVPLFLLEAEPAADSPLRDLFGTPFLEDAIEWRVEPGEPALDGAEMAAFRQGFDELLPSLRARLSADRADQSGRDATVLTEFAERIEPVDSLAVNCAFRGTTLRDIPQRTYHVRRDTTGGFQGFVVWTGPAWPPLPEDAQALAMALAEALKVNTVETFLSFITASPVMRRQLLDLAGASDKLQEVTEEVDVPIDESDADEHDNAQVETPNHMSDGESTEAEAGSRAQVPPDPQPGASRIPLHAFEDLLIDGEVIRVSGETTSSPTRSAATGAGSSHGAGVSAGAGSAPRAAQGTDLSDLDRLGMRITFAFEQRRFPGRTSALLPGDQPNPDAEVLIVDVSTPKMITEARAQSTVVESVFKKLQTAGISEIHPGFDVLTIDGTKIDRLIELKSSGVDAKVQAMSWNEWKTAGGKVRRHFWLYLVGNLRSDLPNAAPFVRAVQDPFGTLDSTESEDLIRKRTVQLRVREFPAADELKLSLRRRPGDGI